MGVLPLTFCWKTVDFLPFVRYNTNLCVRKEGPKDSKRYGRTGHTPKEIQIFMQNNKLRNVAILAHVVGAKSA